MIRGVHAMFYTPQADELRAFFRDKLGLKNFDAGEGWLLFPMDGEIGCHPGGETKPDISLYCENINETVAQLKSKGVEFTQGVEDHGYGLVTYFLAPGGLKMQLYEPKYGKNG